MSSIIKGKSRKIHTLNEFTSVPKIFLAFPIFNTVKSPDESLNGIKIPRYLNMRDVCISYTNLTMFNDFEVFLFILRKVLKSNSLSIEFETFEIMNELRVEKNQRPIYFDIFSKSIEKLSKINIHYEEKVNDVKNKVFFNFISGSMNKEKSQIEVNKRFVDFFNGLEFLYEIDTKTLSSLNNEYQRMLYVLYVCNRKNDVNFFSVDFLKERFRITDKMPEKIFIFKIREANKALQEKGLIEDFEEAKKVKTVKGKEVVTRVTDKFKVKYSYKTLYQRKPKTKKTDISAFDSEDNQFIN